MHTLVLTLAFSMLITAYGALCADGEGHRACEARHSPATCNHILRG